MDARVRQLLAGAVGCALLFGLILALVYGFSGVRELDAKALQGFLGFQRPSVDSLTENLVRVGDPPVAGGLTVLLAGIALLRGRPRTALAVVTLVAVTSVSSQVLKAVLAYPRYGGQLGRAHISPEAFPSGHATAAMSLAIAAVLVVPARMRPLAAVVGCGVAFAVGIGVVALGTHFSSDVAGGFLLAAGCGLAVAAGLRAAALRWPERTVRSWIAPGIRRATAAVAGAGLALVALLGAVLVVAGGVLVLARGDVSELVRGHTVALVVAAALLLLALGLMAAIVAGLGQRGQE